MGEKDGEDAALLSRSQGLVQEGGSGLLLVNARWRKVSPGPHSGGIGGERAVSQKAKGSQGQD